jgi:REP element-mobilizing transposase RayT
MWLKDSRLASKIAESLHYRDGKVYRLDAFTVMSNHVHILIKPLPQSYDKFSGDITYYSLATIMQSLKGYTAYQCNRILRREGEFWAHENYDHWVRDYDEWQRTVAYILNNPVKAGCVKSWADWKWNYKRHLLL